MESSRSSVHTLLQDGWYETVVSHFNANAHTVQMQFCNVIIYSYHYLLDPKIAERVSRELSKDCIVVFDEAHNIDNVCIESLSIDLTEDRLRKATRGANNLDNKITELKSTDAEKLQSEYNKLVEGLRTTSDARDEDTLMANPGEWNINMDCVSR